MFVTEHAFHFMFEIAATRTRKLGRVEEMKRHEGGLMGAADEAKRRPTRAHAHRGHTGPFTRALSPISPSVALTIPPFNPASDVNAFEMLNAR